VTEREQQAIELLLSEPEIVAWLGADPIEHGDDPDALPPAPGNAIEAALASVGSRTPPRPQRRHLEG
jgi:hypothetical protein